MSIIIMLVVVILVAILFGKKENELADLKFSMLVNSVESLKSLTKYLGKITELRVILHKQKKELGLVKENIDSLEAEQEALLKARDKCLRACKGFKKENDILKKAVKYFQEQNAKRISRDLKRKNICKKK